MPVPSQGYYGFHSFPVVDWFCLFIYFVITLNFHKVWREIERGMFLSHVGIEYTNERVELCEKCTRIRDIFF
jgi:hypothetical protein